MRNFNSIAMSFYPLFSFSTCLFSHDWITVTHAFSLWFPCFPFACLKTAAHTSITMQMHRSKHEDHILLLTIFFLKQIFFSFLLNIYPFEAKNIFRCQLYLFSIFVLVCHCLRILSYCSRFLSQVSSFREKTIETLIREILNETQEAFNVDEVLTAFSQQMAFRKKL